MKRIGLFAASALMLGLATSAAGQSYPVKTVRILVPSVPGGGQDVVTRAMAQKFSEAWGQPVIAENRPGAGGNVAHEAVARSAPDGYTILLTTAALAIAPSLYRKLTYDPVTGFIPVSQIMSTYLVLVVHPSLPATVKELIAWARARPGEMTCATPGVGAPVQLHLVKKCVGRDRE